MARTGDGIYLRGNAWGLDFLHKGVRHQVSLGRNIKKSVAKELATIERGKSSAARPASGKKKKDILFDQAKVDFLTWVKRTSGRRPQRYTRVA